MKTIRAAGAARETKGTRMRILKVRNRLLAVIIRINKEAWKPERTKPERFALRRAAAMIFEEFPELKEGKSRAKSSA